MDSLDRIREFYFDGQVPEGEAYDLESLSEKAVGFLLHQSVLTSYLPNSLTLSRANSNRIVLEDKLTDKDENIWRHVVERVCRYQEASGIDYENMNGKTRYALVSFDLEDKTNVTVIFSKTH